MFVQGEKKLGVFCIQIFCSKKVTKKKQKKNFKLTNLAESDLYFFVYVFRETNSCIFFYLFILLFGSFVFHYIKTLLF